MATKDVNESSRGLSSQNLANARRTESDSTRRVGRAARHSEGFAREVAAWLGYVEPKHEAGKLIHQITKGTLRATETWTDCRHAEDDKYVWHWPMRQKAKQGPQS